MTNDNLEINVTLLIDKKEFTKQRNYLNKTLLKIDNKEDYDSLLGLQNLCDYIADQIYYKEKGEV